MPRLPFKHTFISDDALARLYTVLGTVQAHDQEVSIHLLKTKTSVIGTVTSAADRDGLPSNRCVFSLMFKDAHTLIRPPTGIDEAKILQVDRVSVDSDLENIGIASFAYSALAKLGYVVLSDSTQFSDGKRLWKRMAAKAHLRDYKVFVLDDLFGFKRDRNGRPIEYDGRNIDEADIWSRGQDYSKYHVLLMMV